MILLRQYLLKTTDLSRYIQREVTIITHQSNMQPRKYVNSRTLLEMPTKLHQQSIRYVLNPVCWMTVWVESHSLATPPHLLSILPIRSRIP